MLRLTNNKFDPDGYWHSATDSMLFVPLVEDFALFDQNGFDLCPLEKRFANCNKTKFFNHREHRHAIKIAWFEQGHRIEGAVDAVRQKMEENIKSINWQQAGRDILKHKDQWHHLDFFAQSDWKCNYFGIPQERFKMVAWA